MREDNEGTGRLCWSQKGPFSSERKKERKHFHTPTQPSRNETVEEDTCVGSSATANNATTAGVNTLPLVKLRAISGLASRSMGSSWAAKAIVFKNALSQLAGSISWSEWRWVRLMFDDCFDGIAVQRLSCSRRELSGVVSVRIACSESALVMCGRWALSWRRSGSSPEASGEWKDTKWGSL